MLYMLFKVAFFAIPIFIVFPAAYLLVEIYFVNAFINTYSTSTNPQALEHFEIIGRAISATGIALSAMLARSTKTILREGWSFGTFRTWWASLKVFVIAFIVGLAGIYAVTYTLNWYVDSPSSRFCAWQGHYIKDKVQSGTFSPLKSWNSEENYMNINQHQVALSILPYSYCANKILRKEALENKEFTATIFKDFFEYAFSESKQLQNYKRFVNNENQIDRKIDDFYRAYRYVLANDENGGNRALKKVWKAVGGHRLEDPIMQSMYFISKTDKIRGGNRSKSEFKYLLKSSIAARSADIDFDFGDWQTVAENLFGQQFVEQNKEYFYSTPGFNAYGNEDKPIPKDYYDRKISDYVLQKFIFDTANNSLDNKLDKEMYSSVEAMVMPVIILAISAFSMLLLVINVVLTCIRLMVYRNAALSWIANRIKPSSIGAKLISFMVLLGVAYAFYLFPWLLVAFGSLTIIAMLLLGLNVGIETFNESKTIAFSVPTLLNDANEPKAVQAITHPSVLLITILILSSTLPASPSERSLLYSRSESIVASVIKIGARLQFYAYPYTIGIIKGFDVNPWLPHKVNEDKIADHAHALNESNGSRRLLTPIYDSVAWHSLVLANHGALDNGKLDDIRSMFDFYRVKEQYKEKANYADTFLKHNVKSFEKLTWERTFLFSTH